MNSSLVLHQAGFVLANARVLARASAAAYDLIVGQASRLSPLPPAPPAAVDWQNASPAFDFHTDPRTDTHVTFTAYDDCLLIAFRGTKDLRNWITDAEFPKQKLGKQKAEMGSVHAGFLAAINSVMPQIREKVGQASSLSVGSGIDRPEASPALKPILVTGHSLGGALAVLCACLLETQNIPVHSVYTFGQPRVGDRAFAAAYAPLRSPLAPLPLSARTFRLVNQNDVVPRLPGVLLGYCHVGQLALVDALGGLVLNPPLPTVVASDLLGLYRAYRQLDEVLITEHFMAAYLAALEGLETGEPANDTNSRAWGNMKFLTHCLAKIRALRG